MTPEEFLEYYSLIVIPAVAVVLLPTIWYILRGWRSLPKTPWKGRAFVAGLAAIFLASLLELPFMAMEKWVLLAFAAGTIEEPVKLLPLRMFRFLPEGEKWKLVAGTGFFVGILEGAFYTPAILTLDLPLYSLGARVVLVGLHAAWAAVSAGFLLGETGWKRFGGILFSITSHALYDLPPLAFVDGYSQLTLKVLTGLSMVFLIPLPFMVKKATELVRSRTVEETGEVTSPL
ncbi:hypothetical protein A3L12_04245 [Thermococcus sp. P6]|uniref:hypothetical protein n=1 Tax=Thermococcus sp. P6 TaxID=122420 RepID=UPI000B59D2B1|nr:hypothetical protein [Thermococcus sp. P6]ASJ10561.1 hypothetical protein A3L12_04245 [Thermococcus sp. P6]